MTDLVPIILSDEHKKIKNEIEGRDPPKHILVVL